MQDAAAQDLLREMLVVQVPVVPPAQAPMDHVVAQAASQAGVQAPPDEPMDDNNFTIDLGVQAPGDYFSDNEPDLPLDSCSLHLCLDISSSEEEPAQLGQKRAAMPVAGADNFNIDLGVQAPGDYLSDNEPDLPLDSCSLHLRLDISSSEEELADSDNEPDLNLHHEEELPDSDEESEESEESHPAVQVLTAEEKVHQWEKVFVYLCHRYNLGHNAVGRIHNHIKEALVAQLEPEHMKSYDWLRKKAQRGIPEVKADVWTLDENGPGYLRHMGLSKVSQELKRKALCVRTFATIKDMREMAMSLHRNGEHPNFNPDNIVLALDGVPESRSNSGSVTSLEVIVARFEGCQTVWPLEIYRAKRGAHFKLTQSLLLDPIVEQCLEMNLTVDSVVADAPLRAKIRSQVQHTGYYACDLCEWPGERVEGHNKQVYTFESLANNVRRRTHERAAHIFANLELLQSLTKKETDKLRLGYREPIPSLLRLPSFDLIKDVPIDCLHCLFAGVVKKLLYCTFKTPMANNVASNRKVQLEQLLEQAAKVKLPSEFSRSLVGDPFRYKALQYMCLSIIAFPLLFRLLINPTDQYWPLDSSAVERVALWMRMCYLLRATMMDNKDFEVIEAKKRSQRSDAGKHSLLDIQHRWYIQVQHQFGKGVCSYNIHLMGSHLLEIRMMGSMTKTSAFPFESFYGYLIKKTATGARHIGKQALVNSFLAVNWDHHSCQHKLKFNLKRNKAIAQDYLIYDRSTLDFYALVSQTEGNLYRAVKVKKSLYRPFSQFPQEHVLDVLDWELLAVYKYDGEEEDEVTINTSDIDCKAAIIHTGEESVILSIPLSWLALN